MWCRELLKWKINPHILTQSIGTNLKYSVSGHSSRLAGGKASTDYEMFKKKFSFENMFSLPVTSARLAKP